MRKFKAGDWVWNTRMFCAAVVQRYAEADNGREGVIVKYSTFGSICPTGFANGEEYEGYESTFVALADAPSYIAEALRDWEDAIAEDAARAAALAA